MVDTCCKAADRRNKKGSGFTRLWRGVRARLRGVKFSFACQKRTRKAPAISTRWIHEKGAARPFQTPKESRSTKMLAASLNAFLCFSGLRLRRWCYASAGLHVLQGRKVCCEAANERNEKKVQQRRPPPAADTGGDCWGRGQQDTSAAQGTKWTLGTATRLSAAASFFSVSTSSLELLRASSP